MKPRDFIKEEYNLVQAATEMHTDHEIQMAREACYRSASNAIELHRMLKHISEQEGLEAWASEKISLANDYLRTVKEWLEYELMSRLEGRVAENNMEISEATKETTTGRVHKAEPGGYGRRDDDDGKKKEKAAEPVKRGRGRPKKDADSETGEVKNWDTDTLQSWIVGSVPKKLPGKASVKHKIKDESANLSENEFQDQFSSFLSDFKRKRGIGGGASAAAPTRSAAPAPEVDKEQMMAKLKELQSRFDPAYEYSDDHAFWSEQNEIAKEIRSIKRALSQQGVTEGFKNTYEVGDRVDSPMGTGTIVAVSKNVNVDGRVKVKLDDPRRAGEDGKHKDSFILTTTQINHISEQGVAEGTKETSTGRVHKAEPGGYGRRDDDDGKKKEKTAEPVKRGRGRPKKDADSETGEVKNWDTDTLQRWIVGSVPKKLPGKASVKHKIKDEPDEKMDESMRRKQTKEMASAGASSAGAMAVAPMTAKKKIIKR